MTGYDCFCPCSQFNLLIHINTIFGEHHMPDIHTLDRPEILQALFHPRHSIKTNVPPHAHDIDITVPRDAVIGCRFFTAEKEAPTILFFHGNGEIVPDYDEIGPHYVKQGLNFIVTDYRGYGWSTGHSTTTTLLSDSHVIYNYISTWLPDHDYTGSVFTMGRSLGSACAIELAAAYNDRISGLIIESGFAESMPLAVKLGLDPKALGISEKDGFQNATKIASVTKPTLILHGVLDHLISISQAEKLHAHCGARSKELQIIPGADHNTLIAVGGILYFQVIKQFIDKATGVETWRSRRKRYKKERNY